MRTRNLLAVLALALSACSDPIVSPSPTLQAEEPGQAGGPSDPKGLIDTTAPVVLLGQQHVAITPDQFRPAEWQVSVRANDKPIRIRVLFWKDPVAGTTATTYGSPATISPVAGVEYYPAGTSGTARYNMPTLAGECGRGQADLEVDYADGRGFRNFGWLIINAGVNCIAPPPPPPSVTPSCPTSGNIFMAKPEWVQESPSQVAVRFQLLHSVGPVQLTVAAYRRDHPTEKHPQTRTYNLTGVYQHNPDGRPTTIRIPVPTERPQADLMLCGEAPMVYDSSNAKAVDARTVSWWYR